MRPVIVHVATVDEVQFMPPGAAVATYEEMADPPFDADAVQLTTICPLPATPLTDVGGVGTDGPGITGNEGADDFPDPAELTATTVKV